MEIENEILEKNPLFLGLSKDCFSDLFHCLQVERKTFHKGEIIFSTDQTAVYLGIVLKGFVTSEYIDYDGNRNIIASIGVGELFGDAFSCSRKKKYMVDIVSQCDVEVLFIAVERIIHSCSEAQKYQVTLLSNLNTILAEKYVTLSRKSIINSGRTTREKLLSYFYELNKLSLGQPFAIPFTQQQLADYLFVERSGLSTEFNKLKKEGLIIMKDGLCLYRGPLD
jgi:CRP-like cAMP-binding protein